MAKARAAAHAIYNGEHSFALDCTQRPRSCPAQPGLVADHGLRLVSAPPSSVHQSCRSIAVVLKSGAVSAFFHKKLAKDTVLNGFVVKDKATGRHSLGEANDTHHT